MTNDILLTTDEVAERLGISPKSIATWRSEGRDLLPSFKVGNRVRYRASDLNDFIAAGTETDGGGDDGDDDLDADSFDDEEEDESDDDEDSR